MIMKKMITLATMLVVSGIAFADDSPSNSPNNSPNNSNVNTNTNVTHQAQAQAQSQAVINSGNSTNTNTNTSNSSSVSTGSSISNSGNSTASGGYATGGTVSNSGNSSSTGGAGGDATSNSGGNAMTSVYEQVRQAPSVAQGSFAIAGCSVAGNAGGSDIHGSAFLGFGWTPDECYLFMQAQAYQSTGHSQAACEVLNHTKAAKRLVKDGFKLPECTPAHPPIIIMNAH